MSRAEAGTSARPDQHIASLPECRDAPEMAERTGLFVECKPLQLRIPGDLTDGLPHASILVSKFCIPATGNGALDGIANLPGPGSLSLPGMPSS